MKKTILLASLVLGIGFTNCSKQNDPSTQMVESNVKTTNDRNNLVTIVEIPTIDFSRAVLFYKAILTISIEEVTMGGLQMGLFPGNGETVNVALVNGEDYKPSTDGTIIYLNAGDDLQIVLDKVKANGGKVIVPKTEINAEMGFFAMFTDTEGNKIGLHSAH